MPTLSRKRVPPATRRRALELLDASRDGCTEAIMLAHGFTISQMVELVRAGLAIATAERVVAGRRKVEVATFQITEAEWRASWPKHFLSPINADFDHHQRSRASGAPPSGF